MAVGTDEITFCHFFVKEMPCSACSFREFKSFHGLRSVIKIHDIRGVRFSTVETPASTSFLCVNIRTNLIAMVLTPETPTRFTMGIDGSCGVRSSCSDIKRGLWFFLPTRCTLILSHGGLV